MIRIVEVGPRDGLQNEKAVIPTETKIQFIDRLSETGLKEIEVGAFVSPERVPQMADSLDVFESIQRRNGVTYSALVPNEVGLDRALEAEVDKIAVFTAASETFNQNNINASIAESLRRFEPVVARAKDASLPVRGYISTSFWCPYAGKVRPDKVMEVCRALLNMGVDELSIGDTIGKASPDEVKILLDLLLKHIKPDSIFLHFHDTYKRAVENALCAHQQYAITGFDSSAGGIGGCPYAPGASGNVATEGLLQAFKNIGVPVPTEPATISSAAEILTPYLSHPTTS